MIRNQLIPSLRGQAIRGEDNRPSRENAHTPTDSAVNPGLVKPPPHEKAWFVSIADTWTYHNPHTGGLHSGTSEYKQAENPPPLLPEPLSTAEHNEERNDAQSLKNNRKRHPKPDGPPHRAEVPVFTYTVLARRE
ncbi:uncharacterized protein DSM5745_07601 [Aspergillus mulundensis]|uniref:Uncharacterized protein n=1 Tax=Aspergillus mulundensis TaxID=1810919 RepID=A0A3D8REG0_9EURO|nr:hypothetical protein DSM5745_07601 [Aspergillus mulundensis]RDW72429.1 hypothetical protein DSM5745_07601 [Aspergillus mulundensis]